MGAEREEERGDGTHRPGHSVHFNWQTAIAGIFPLPWHPSAHEPRLPPSPHRTPCRLVACQEGKEEVITGTTRRARDFWASAAPPSNAGRVRQRGTAPRALDVACIPRGLKGEAIEIRHRCLRALFMVWTGSINPATLPSSLLLDVDVKKSLAGFHP
jgi:hypothetical protein